MELSDYPITILLIAINVIVSILAFNRTDIMNKAILWPYGIKRYRQYYRFISSGFVHADYMHLLFNMFTLFFFGRNLELILRLYGLGGTISYLALYFIALVIADLPTYRKHQDDQHYLCLGASGAVAAVVFANIVFTPWSSIYLYGALRISAFVYAVLYIIYCIYMSKRGNDHINHDAHLWGALFGLAFTVVLVATLQPELINPLIRQLGHPSLFGQ